MDHFAENADENGELSTSVGDYHTRFGQTGNSICEHQVNSEQVLHTILRTFDHFMKTVVRMYAGVYSWSVTSNQQLFIDKAKVSTNMIFLNNLDKCIKT